MTGWRPEEAAGQPFEHVFRIIDGASRQSCPNPMDLAVRLNETVGLTSNCVLIRRDGFECPIEDSAAPIHDRQGRVTGAVLVFRDVSAARAVSLQLSHLAAHDLLTDLPNRMLLNDRLSQAIASARRQRHRLAVLFLDLDRFKQINDTLGHEIGDRLFAVGGPAPRGECSAVRYREPPGWGRIRAAALAGCWGRGGRGARAEGDQGAGGAPLWVGAPGPPPPGAAGGSISP